MEANEDLVGFKEDADAMLAMFERRRRTSCDPFLVEEEVEHPPFLCDWGVWCSVIPGPQTRIFYRMADNLTNDEQIRCEMEEGGGGGRKERRKAGREEKEGDRRKEGRRISWKARGGEGREEKDEEGEKEGRRKRESEGEGG
ncbi:Hypothetical predicted protein [Octopus vulgaris]|uniref:Uncharacterized protein n=1 Tax=Octopus vulgaris TaxID=6645 RepID=A0AA36BQ94_OCTVU|nr:Hypothetical predicted protein [Octopus vulgaris]